MEQCRWIFLGFLKRQYHGPYKPGGAQVLMGTMTTGHAPAKIQLPSLILKAAATREVRKANEEAAKVMQEEN